MQTFLPFSDFARSARCLDNKRLGKQRVECLQILKALSDPSYGWQNHPAVRMWRGYKPALALYGCIICKEWTSKGWKDSCLVKMLDHFLGIQDILDSDMLSEETPYADIEYAANLILGTTSSRASVNQVSAMKLCRISRPAWLGNDAFHLSHRSNLLRKLPEHYAPLFEPGLRDDLPYIWPV